MLNRIGSIALALAVLTGTPSIVAQEVPDEETPTTFRGFFMIGWQKLDLDELNSRMVPNGFPSLSENLLSLGGGGWGWKDRFLIGGEGHALLGPDEATADGAYKTQMAGGYGQLDLGYRIYTGERLNVAPVLGLGGGVVSIDLFERSSPTFDEILSDPLTGTHLSASGFHFDVSVAIDARLTRRVKEDGDEDGFAIGFRAGYAFSPGDWDWELNDQTELPGGPQLGISGPYVRFMLGGWSRDSGGG